MHSGRVRGCGLGDDAGMVFVRSSCDSSGGPLGDGGGGCAVVPWLRLGKGCPERQLQSGDNDITIHGVFEKRYSYSGAGCFRSSSVGQVGFATLSRGAPGGGLPVTVSATSHAYP